MKYTLLEILENDQNTNRDFEDEKIASNLYLCSLSTSLKEISIMSQNLDKYKKEYSKNHYENLEKDYNNKCKGNDWLIESCNKPKFICSINFDLIAKCCNTKDTTSVDAFIIDYNKNQCFLIEFKNCTKSRLIDKYMEGEDSVIKKFKTSKNLLNQLTIDNFNKDTLISNTAVLIVYCKNDIASSTKIYTPPELISPKDNEGKQSSATRKNNNKKGRACKYQFYKNKSIEDKINSFKRQILNLKYSNKHPQILFAKEDFMNLINNGMFDSIDWGIYKNFF